MVIAHVIDSLEVGGAEAVVTALCRLHAAAGHRVEVHCLTTAGPLAAELEQEGVPVHMHAPGERGGDRPGSCFGLSGDPARTSSTVTTRPPPFARPRRARLTGARAIVSTRHGMGPVPFRLRPELKFWITAAVFCDRVVAVCDAARRNMTAGAGPVAHKVVTIRNGADPPRCRAERRGPPSRVHARQRGPARPRRKISPRCSARWPWRARQCPISACGSLAAASEGPALRQLCAELDLDSAVRFCGERRDVGNWLHAADVFVLSSTSEGLPISMLEAMAAGLPAIVTEVGALPELVALSGAGTTVPVRSVDRLARAIVEFANRRHELAALGERASRCYRAHFTPDRMARDYLRLPRLSARGAAAKTWPSRCFLYVVLSYIHPGEIVPALAPYRITYWVGIGGAGRRGRLVLVRRAGPVANLQLWTLIILRA